MVTLAGLETLVGGVTLERSQARPGEDELIANWNDDRDLDFVVDGKRNRLRRGLGLEPTQGFAGRGRTAPGRRGAGRTGPRRERLQGTFKVIDFGMSGPPLGIDRHNLFQMSVAWEASFS